MYTGFKIVILDSALRQHTIDDTLRNEQLNADNSLIHLFSIWLLRGVSRWQLLPLYDFGNKKKFWFSL